MRFSPMSVDDEDFEKIVYEEDKHSRRTVKVYNPTHRRNRYDEYEELVDRDDRDEWDDR